MTRKTTQKIFVAGHRGMVGSALVRRLKAMGYSNIQTATRDEVDFTNQSSVDLFFSKNSVDQVYLAAAKVGGIHANNVYPADFISENLLIVANILRAAYINGVGKLLFLGSSCIYPKYSSQPIGEDELMTGKLEPTNEPYAIAKIAGIKLCESYNRQYGCDYRSVMPTNLYGPNDNFNLENSHVIPSLLRRFHDAKKNGDEEVVVWGTGHPLREFLHVDEMADASIHVMELDYDTYSKHTSPMLSHINVGTGDDCSICELAEMIKSVVGFEGKVVYDSSRPDGTPRKLLDVSRLEQLGWKSSVSLEEGLKATYQWFVENESNFRK